MSSISLYNALIAAGVNQELATAAANDVARTEQVATKLDLANMEIRLVKWMFGIALGIAALSIAILKLA